MKHKIGLALGIGLGRAVYECARRGFSSIDWTGVAFVAAISLLLLRFIPTGPSSARRLKAI